MKQWLGAAALVLTGCVSLPPTHDPEGCDRVAEEVKRFQSDLVIDGDLYCATDDGDCELTVSRKIAGKASAPRGTVIPIHILRQEADAYSDELSKEGAIAFCYPAELWFPSEGHYVGRYYLRQEIGGRYHMAFYPRTKD